MKISKKPLTEMAVAFYTSEVRDLNQLGLSVNARRGRMVQIKKQLIDINHKRLAIS